MRIQKVLFIVVLLATVGSVCMAKAKIALVIGNKNYSNHTQLKNPINDAKLIKKTLEGLDFEVIYAYDADIGKIDSKLNVFMHKAKDAEIAVVYYAGHGIGVEGVNYLIPLDAQNLSKSNLSRKLISLRELQDAVARANKFGVVFFDACRNSFFTQNIEGLSSVRGSRALVRPSIKYTKNILVSFSTQAGTLAKDDVNGGNHSPYALALSEKLTLNKDIRLVMGSIKDRVLALTGNEQEPIDRSSLGGDEFMIVGKKALYANPRNQQIAVEQNIDSKANIITFFKKLVALMEKKDIDAFMRYFDDEVLYYGSWTSKYKIRHSKQVYLDKWNKLEYKIKDIVISNIDNSSMKDITILMDFEVQNNKKIIRGQSKARYKLNIYTNKIVYENSKIIKRNEFSRMKKNKIKNVRFKTTYMHVNLYKTPNLHSSIVVILSRNSKLTYVKDGEDNHWIKVQTSNGAYGWIERKRVKRI